MPTISRFYGIRIRNEKTVNAYVTNESGTHVKPVRVRRVKPLEPYLALFTFTDGSKRIIDLDRYLRGPVFSPICKDPALFKAMFVDEGTVAWPGDIDIDPDTLYYGENPIPWETNTRNSAKPVSPKLRHERAISASNSTTKASGTRKKVSTRRGASDVKRKRLRVKANKK